MYMPLQIKCIVTVVGSCIVSPENVVVGVGHHSLVEGMSKDSLEPKDEITDYCE